MAAWISSKFKSFTFQNDNAKKIKRLGETERNYLQKMLIRGLYPEYTKNTYNNNRKKNNLIFFLIS